MRMINLLHPSTVCHARIHVLSIVNLLSNVGHLQLIKKIFFYFKAQSIQPRSFSISGSSTFRKKSFKKRKSIRNEKGKSLSSAPASAVSLTQLEPYPSSGETMKLNEFVKRFSHYLPLCVHVEEGYCGTEERYVSE